MEKYLVELAYDGTHYSGWQRQPNANTIQEEIENAILKINKTATQIVGCGRTDAGVHAMQSFFHMEIELSIESSELMRRLNKCLPISIAIKSIRLVPDDFHARFHATSRSYDYLISLEKNPFHQGKAWAYPFGGSLEIEKLNNAANILMEFKDFYTFSKSNTDVKTYLCTIEKVLWHSKGDLLVFSITANRFLRGMIRLIVGMCVNVARNQVSLDEVRHALKHQERLQKSWSVPPEGLYLKDVIYPGIVSESS